MKHTFAIIGLILLLISIGFDLYIGNVLTQETQKAVDRDKYVVGPPPITASGNCFQFSLDAQAARRVIADSDTLAILVRVAQKDPNYTCKAQISLNAPAFNTSPSDLTYNVTLPPNGKNTLSWVLIPQKLGTFDITVSAFPDQNSNQVATLGLTVTNVFGLSPWDLQIFSAIGTFLGPLLTISWWYERWKERKKNKEADQEVTKIGDKEPAMKAKLAKMSHIKKR